MSMRVAMGLFEQATIIDPNYALAWAGIADCYGQLMQMGLFSDDASSDFGRKGLDAARRAIALEPRLPEAHKAEALVLEYQGKREASMAALRRALEVSPRFVPALINLAVFCMEPCDVAQAERSIRRALVVDPASAFATGWLALILHITGREEESVATARGVLERSEDIFYAALAYSLIGANQLRCGDLAGARSTLADAARAGMERGKLETLEGMIALHSGNLEEAARLLTSAESSKELEVVTTLWCAEIAIALGDLPRAIRMLSRPVARTVVEGAVRLFPELHPVLGHEPFVPRRSEHILVWPREAPPLPADIAALFTEVRLEPGLP
jgi:tetratricopeptide (TPR) repeat protein